jgi:ABC-type Fe3+-hydroxamate transport system substrate-binding protein
VRGRPRPRTLIVLDRSPLYLVGRETFLDELLGAVGAVNLGAGIGSGYPQASLEWLVEAAPELLLDLSPQAESGASPAEFWSRWPSLPAVRQGRVVGLDATAISLPGPDLDRALRTLARAVHGDEIDALIAAELARAQGAR